SGSGRIDVIDLSGTGGGHVVGNRISNPRRAGTLINGGLGAQGENNTIAIAGRTKPGAVGGGPSPEANGPRPRARRGLVLEGRGFATGNVVLGTGKVIAALFGFNTVIGNRATGSGGQPTGIFVSGSHDRIEGNHVVAFNCIRGDPATADNQSIVGN